ncbi:MAG: helix-turn-helix domain-containing protein [Betaproteobacteria bacterium]|nr:helix-turn-helix domain-containing protein [Betaproteobacteria bacterium]
METKTNSPISLAVSAVGGMPALAKGCGVSVQAVHKWIKLGRPPAERCIEIELLTGGRISRYRLRPDVFGEQAA